MSERSGSLVAAALFVLFTAACGADPTTTPATPAQADTAPPSVTTERTTDTTTAATTTEPTTVATTTTVTTAPPATTVRAVPAGWSAADRESLPSYAFPPCCADTWYGDVSPAFTTADESLVDGSYAARMQWPDDPTQPLAIELFRFEQCAAVPSSCESLPEGIEYGPDQLGVDWSTSRTITAELDDGVRVVVVGWNGDLVVEQARGTDLAELAVEVNRAYADVFASRFVAGEEPAAIVADVLADPRGGFHPEAFEPARFIFTPQSGPPLLLQTVFPYVDGHLVAGRGTDMLAIRSIDVVEDQVTIYVFAAYVP